VDTVGGLLAQRLGRVPLPGAEAEIGGLRLRAEGGEDARGRMRIRSLLVWRPTGDEAPETDGRGGTDETDGAPADGDRPAADDDAERPADTGADLAPTGARDGEDGRG
jgi:hypothetical protein